MESNQEKIGSMWGSEEKKEDISDIIPIGEKKMDDKPTAFIDLMGPSTRRRMPLRADRCLHEGDDDWHEYTGEIDNYCDDWVGCHWCHPDDCECSLCDEHEVHAYAQA